MKKILFLILVITIVRSGFSQEIVRPDYIWSNLEEHCHIWGSSYITEYFYFDNDTIINDTTYKKVWIAEEENHPSWNFFWAFIREDNNRVYYRPAYGKEGLIYDFNIGLGDSVLIDNPRAAQPVWLHLTQIDTIDTEGGERLRWKLETDLYPVDDYWIRGVGSTAGVLNSSTSVFGGLCGLYELLCKEEDGNLVYLNPEYQTCFLYTVGVKDSIKPVSEINYIPSTQVVTVKPDPNKGVNVLLLTDIMGNVLYKQANINKSQEISLERYVPGIYMISFVSDEGSTIYKFVKQK